jgi:hypothetical protein
VQCDQKGFGENDQNAPKAPSVEPNAEKNHKTSVIFFLNNFTVLNGILDLDKYRDHYFPNLVTMSVGLVVW